MGPEVLRSGGSAVLLVLVLVPRVRLLPASATPVYSLEQELLVLDTRGQSLLAINNPDALIRLTDIRCADDWGRSRRDPRPPATLKLITIDSLWIRYLIR